MSLSHPGTEPRLVKSFCPILHRLVLKIHYLVLPCGQRHTMTCSLSCSSVLSSQHLLISRLPNGRLKLWPRYAYQETFFTAQCLPQGAKADKACRTTQSLPECGNADLTPTAGPRSPWVLNLLGASPAVPARDMSNLTAKPKRRPMKGPASLGANTENVHYDRSATPASDEQAFVGRRQQDAANISKTIYDLEKLLKDALVMAHQAADKDDDNQAMVHRSAASRSGVSSDAGSSLSGGSDEEEHYTSVPLSQMDNDVTLMEPNNGSNNHGTNQRSKNAIPQQTSTRNASIVPPIGDGTFSKTQLGDESKPHRGPPITVQPPTTVIRDNNIEPFSSKDWAILKRQPTKRRPEPEQSPTLLRRPTSLQAPLKEVRSFKVRPQKPLKKFLSEEVVPQRINRYVLHYSIFTLHSSSESGSAHLQPSLVLLYSLDEVR